MDTPTGYGDAELVRLTRAGETDAYKDLVARYQGHVYGLAYSIVGNWVDAQDVAQETFIRAYANLDQLRDEARFAAWLRRVAFSVAMNWLKTYKPGLFEQLDGRVDLDKLEIPDFRPGPSEIAEKRELADAVLRAVDSLPPKYRLPLSMFHLNGLSYQKVADFLDIPLGTAKSLIHRAREKLKDALATYAVEEVAPMVQEVFNEHKLPPEFARKVLDGIADLDWRTTGETTLCGSLVACMEFIKEPVTYDFAMGVSGAAFKLLWHPDWCPSNNSMGILGEEPRRRFFRAIGREYEFVGRTDSPDCEERFRSRIIASIDKGRPVIAWGIVGPPDEGVITGYDKNGEVLVGRSYFDAVETYYEKPDWFPECWGLIIIGDKTEVAPDKQILREALEWAVQLARTASSADLPTAHGKHITGLAAYDAWAKALERDEDFPPDDIKTMTLRCNVSNSVTLPGATEARRMAASFLRSSVDLVGDPAKSAMLDAAALYDEEAAILGEAMQLAPFCFQPEEKRLEFAQPDRRRKIANLILQAKEKYALATECLERALEAM